MISFDKLLHDISYRNRLQRYFKKMGVLNEMKYDFSESKENNESLVVLAEKMGLCEESVLKEDAIRVYHELFEDKLNESLSR